MLSKVAETDKVKRGEKRNKRIKEWTSTEAHIMIQVYVMVDDHREEMELMQETQIG